MKKIIISLAIIGVVAAVTLGVTGAWWSSSATSNNASFHSGTMKLQLANSNGGTLGDTVDETWNQSNMEPGGTILDKALYMKNVGSIDAHRMSFAVTGLSTDTGMAQQMRITKLEYGAYKGSGNWNMKSLLTGGAGADLSNYVAPTHCDVKVNLPGGTYHTISGAVSAATTSGEVICVGPGNYSDNWEKESGGAGGDGTGFPITIGKSITLVSMEGPDTTTITAPVGKDAIDIAANNVMIKGFTITGAKFGIDIEGATGVTVEDNIIKNYSEEGIWMDGGNATIANNIIKANDNGTPSNSHSVDSIYTENGAIAIIDHNNLENNKYGPNAYNPSIDDWSTAAGIAAHTSSKITATYNTISGNDFGIQIKERGVTMTANYNDISENTRDFFFEAKNGCTPVTIFNAKNNWWGDYSPADHVSVGSNCATTPISDIVDYTPYAGGPFIGYINGVDSNSNHYADLGDFYYQYSHEAQGLNVKPGLNHGQWGQLDMAVQLDGPTTHDEYQGKTLGMVMTVNMNQH